MLCTCEPFSEGIVILHYFCIFLLFNAIENTRCSQVNTPYSIHYRLRVRLGSAESTYAQTQPFGTIPSPIQPSKTFHRIDHQDDLTQSNQAYMIASLNRYQVIYTELIKTHSLERIFPLGLTPKLSTYIADIYGLTI